MTLFQFNHYGLTKNGHFRWTLFEHYTKEIHFLSDVVLNLSDMSYAKGMSYVQPLFCTLLLIWYVECGQYLNVSFNHKNKPGQ